ncbi:MAG: TetR/AcrR family transcriptional regulator [Anaerolineae bacterium]|nr:TetR/AcrR family transcriptional regulator [Anaerolineae bacterium]
MNSGVAPSPTLSPRRQRNRDLMVESILESARAIMREDGVAALSMHELARRLDMRAPSLYHYFSGKMDIYDSLFRLGFTLFADRMQPVTQNAGSWQEELELTFQAYMSFALENPELYQLCFERPVPGFVPSQESLALSFGQLNATYERAARIHELANTGLPPRQAVDLVIAMMHGLTALHLANEPHLPVGQGRFGALIPAALSVLDKAWSNP